MLDGLPDTFNEAQLFPQKSPRKVAEITATSEGNHRNFCRKSPQLLKEITAIIEGNQLYFRWGSTVFAEQLGIDVQKWIKRRYMEKSE